MAIATVGYTLSTTAYTSIALGFRRARIVTDSNKRPARIVVAPTQPSADSDDWFPLQPGSILSIEGLDGNTIWAKAEAEPSGADVTQKVRVLTDTPDHSLVLKPLF